MSTTQEILDDLVAWLDVTDSDKERAKHPKQFDMWITGYEQALLDVEAILERGGEPEGDATSDTDS